MISDAFAASTSSSPIFTFSVLFLYGEKYKFQIVHERQPVFIFGTNPVGRSSSSRSST